MGYRYDLSSISTPAPSTSTSQPKKIVARVVDVVLGEDHPEFETLGSWNAIGAIKYKPLDRDLSEEDSTKLPVAYPLRGNIKVIPTVNEIVLLEKGPSEQLSESASSSKTYYTDIIGIWNHPNHNAYPDTRRNDGEYTLGEGFIEASDVNPLIPFIGDVLLEGRQGQSLRFTGTNPLDIGQAANKPLIILSNGQRVTENGFICITEDINQDASSIYLTNSHKLPLDSLNFPRNSYESAPISEESYEENQVAIVSDRVILRSRTDNTLISSAKSTGLLGKTVNLDGNSTIILESPRINLGKQAKEPAVKGDSIEKVLSTIVDNLGELGARLITAGSELPSGTLIGAGTDLTAAVAQIKAILPGIKSNKTFVE